MTGGLLDKLRDPEFMAHLAAREYAAERIAERFFLSRRKAFEALEEFEINLSHSGHTLH